MGSFVRRVKDDPKIILPVCISIKAEETREVANPRPRLFNLNEIDDTNEFMIHQAV